MWVKRQKGVWPLQHCRNASPIIGDILEKSVRKTHKLVLHLDVSYLGLHVFEAIWHSFGGPETVSGRGDETVVAWWCTVKLSSLWQWWSYGGGWIVTLAAFFFFSFMLFEYVLSQIPCVVLSQDTMSICRYCRSLWTFTRLCLYDPNMNLIVWLFLVTVLGWKPTLSILVLFLGAFDQPFSRLGRRVLWQGWGFVLPFTSHSNGVHSISLAPALLSYYSTTTPPPPPPSLFRKSFLLQLYFREWCVIVQSITLFWIIAKNWTVVHLTGVSQHSPASVAY